jgi:hypothetical protein
MGGFGRVVQESTGRPIMVSADGRPDWKAGGVTIDWTAVVAVSGSDETLDDETIVKIGDKYLQFGTILGHDAATGKYKPTDAPVRGESYIVNETVVMSELGSDHPAVIEGGLVWRSRLQVDGVGQPTLDDVLTAMPSLKLAEGSNAITES